MEKLEFPPPVNPNNPGRGPMIIVTTWTFTTLTMIVVGLRLYLRATLTKFFSVEDWLMLAATVLVVTHQSLVTVSYTYGMGKHDADIEQPDQLVTLLKFIWVSAAPGMLVSIIARISIAMLLVRLFGDVHKSFKWFTIGFTAIQTVFCGLIIPFTYAQVKPVEGLWNIYDPNVKKWNPNIVLYMEYIGQSLYTLSDVVYVFWPVFMVWNLNMPMRRKIGLMILLASSLVTAISSIEKTIVAQGGPHYQSDAQYHSSMGVLWSVLEEDLVIIMGCVPTLRTITKVKILGFSNLASSLSSLFKGSWSKRSTSQRYSTSGAYHDLEMNPSRFGHAGVGHGSVPDDPVITHGQEESIEDLIVPVASNRVLRTDEFTISYSRY